jgi:transcriptional antiterminator Rof (Rho-off)
VKMGAFVMSRYEPIACGLHEYYQLAVVKQALLDLAWEDDAGRMQRGRARPKDVYTHAKAEYLLAEFTDLGEVAIRLDRIKEARWANTGISLVG